MNHFYEYDHEYKHTPWPIDYIKHPSFRPKQGPGNSASRPLSAAEKAVRKAKNKQAKAARKASRG